jgi:hypothetical protein
MENGNIDQTQTLSDNIFIENFREHAYKTRKETSVAFLFSFI